MKRSELSWPELNRLATGLALLGGSVMSLCFCLNLLSLDDLAGFLTSNELSFARRNWFLATMGAAFVLPALLSARWIKNQPLAVTSRTLWDWGHRAAPLIVVGLADRYRGTASEWSHVLLYLAIRVPRRRFSHGEEIPNQEI